MHIIDTNEFEITLNNIQANVDKTFSRTEDILLIKQLETEIRKTKHSIKTLSLHRRKRGLINLGGKIANWLFGTMDSDDKAEIEQHLKTIDLNNHNAIANLNKQIKINNELQSNLKTLQKRMNESLISTLKTLQSVTYDVTKKGIRNLQFLSTLTDINLLNSEINKVQQNIVFARHGIMSQSILTDKEIDEYDINVGIQI